MNPAPIACCLAAALACAAAAPVPEDTLTEEQKRSLELPRSWDLRDIADEAPPYGAGGKVYVLAWVIKEDARPLRVESCLVLKDLGKESEAGRWCLSHLYRHPHGRDNTWTLPPLWVSPPAPLGPEKPVAISHLKRLKTKPTNKDLDAAAKEVQWRFGVDGDWKIVSCAVCERNWFAATGEKPVQFFGGK